MVFMAVQSKEAIEVKCDVIKQNESEVVTTFYWFQKFYFTPINLISMMKPETCRKHMIHVS